MNDKDIILEPLYYSQNLGEVYVNSPSIRMYVNKLLQNANLKNVPKQPFTLKEMWEIGTLREGIYVSYSGPSIRNKEGGRFDWSIVVISKGDEDFQYASITTIFKINKGKAQENGRNFIKMDKKQQFKTQLEMMRKGGVGEVKRLYEAESWVVKETIVEETDAVALKSDNWTRVHSPLPLGGMMNWGDLTAFDRRPKMKTYKERMKKIREGNVEKEEEDASGGKGPDYAGYGWRKGMGRSKIK